MGEIEVALKKNEGIDQAIASVVSREQVQHLVAAVVSTLPQGTVSSEQKGNLGADYQFRHAFQKNDAFHISYQNNFVEEFFLSWENDGLDETKAIIPRQFVHNASIGYTFPEKKYSLSLECRNVSDELVYDNYKVQKPGRSFYVKFRVFLQ